MPEHEERRGTYGNVIEYTAGDDWESYTEQLEFYFIANEVQDEKRKKAILLANMCAETFQLLKDLLVPAKPKDDAATYKVIVQKLKEHTKPEKSELVARYEFDNRNRKSGESVNVYVATLKHMAVDCKFSDAVRSERLRDRLVAGIKDDKMLRELLKMKLSDLSFDEAVRKCLAIERANEGVLALQNEQVQEAKVNKRDGSEATKDKPRPYQERNPSTPKQQPKTTPATCYRCEGQHDPKSCPFSKAKCCSCGKTGHISKECRQSKETRSQTAHPVNVMRDDDSMKTEA